MSMMKAVRIQSYGGREVLSYEDAPRPAVGEGEVLIRVYATSVNPFDCALRAGYVASYFEHTLPLVIGTDVAGVIEEMGPGVSSFARGDDVYARAGVYRDGANAEYVAVAASDVALMPLTLDHVHAAALPHVVLTAWQALYVVAELAEGQTVLIHAAAGGVGHVAVQLAKLRGARVIGTATINRDLLVELGVDEVIDYSTATFEEFAGSVDVVLDLVGGETQERSWALLKPGGILISTIQSPSEEMAAAHGVRQHLVVSAPPIGPTLTEVAALVDSGKIRPVVSTVLPLEEVTRAHELIEGRHTRGKVVLTVAT